MNSEEPRWFYGDLLRAPRRFNDGSGMTLARGLFITSLLLITAILQKLLLR